MVIHDLDDDWATSMTEGNIGEGINATSTPTESDRWPERYYARGRHWRDQVDKSPQSCGASMMGSPEALWPLGTSLKQCFGMSWVRSSMFNPFVPTPYQSFHKIRVRSTMFNPFVPSNLEVSQKIASQTTSTMRLREISALNVFQLATRQWWNVPWMPVDFHKQSISGWWF